MCLANIIPASVQPEIGIAMPCAVLLPVVQDSIQDIGDLAVVTSAVTCSQDDDVAISRLPGIAIPASIVGHLPIPFRLGLEVSRLGLVILYCCRYYSFPRRIIAVVVDWHVAEKPEEHYQDGDD